MKKRVCALLLFLALVLPGCKSSSISAKNLTQDLTPRTLSTTVTLAVHNSAITDFGVRLFQETADPQANTLISPLSVLCALAMTANGAKGETLAQMEQVLGLDLDTLNDYLRQYLAVTGQEGSPLRLADSIWFTDSPTFTVNQDFLQTITDYYGADIYQAPFDNSTLRDINTWVEEHTKGMIQDILDQIPPEAVMYLVNALAFEAEWSEVYQASQVQEHTFTTQEGEEHTLDFLWGREYLYLEDENATGFIKYYKGGQYAFVALLPREGLSTEEYLDTLTGEGLHELLSQPTEGPVDTAIPKFESETSLELSQVLSDMGMPLPFQWGQADLSGLGNDTQGDLVINRVIHQTFISLGEKGTKAGAATIVENNAGSAMPSEEPPQVILDRPFVYLLMDCKENIPFFLGTMMDPSQG